MVLKISEGQQPAIALSTRWRQARPTSGDAVGETFDRM
jgi:hypothetical protein